MRMDPALLPVPQTGLFPCIPVCHPTGMTRHNYGSPFAPGAKPSLHRNVFQGGGRLAQLQLPHFSMSRDLSCLKRPHDTGCAWSPAITYLRIVWIQSPAQTGTQHPSALQLG